MCQQSRELVAMENKDVTVIDGPPSIGAPIGVVDLHRTLVQGFMTYKGSWMSRIISILKFYDPFRDGELGEAHPVMYVQFFRYVRLVSDHRLCADIQAARYFLMAVALGYKLKHLLLSIGQFFVRVFLSASMLAEISCHYFGSNR